MAQVAWTHDDMCIFCKLAYNTIFLYQMMICSVYNKFIAYYTINLLLPHISSNYSKGFA